MLFLNKILALFITLSAFSTYSSAQSPVAFKRFIERRLNGWEHSFNQFNVADFHKSEIRSFDKRQTWSAGELTDFYLIYKPLLAFCKDSSRFIDIYSAQINLEKDKNGYTANPDVDGAVFLVDSKANDRSRIFFNAPSRWIDDADWLTDTTFLLVGITKYNSNQKHPLIVFGNTKRRSLIFYESKNTACFQKKSGYQSAKLSAMHIKGL